MARKQRSGLQKLSFISFFLCVVLGGVLFYLKTFSAQPVDAKMVIEEGVRNAKQAKNLSPEQEHLLRIQISIVDYMAKNGLPPGSLYELVPTYFDTVPQNPRTKKPYYYARTGKQYVLRADEAGVMTASASSGAGKAVQGSAVVASAVDFVNPNEMKPEEFVYDPANKRDPFRPFDFSKRSKVDSTKTPLEQYELGQLRVAAILDDFGGGRKAILQDAEGRGYTVTPGTKVGLNGGVIVSIEPKLLKVLETAVDFTGVEKQNVIEMKLIGEADAPADSKSKKKRKRNSR